MSEATGTDALDVTGAYPGQYVNAPSLDNPDVPARGPASLRSVTFSGGQWLELSAALADSLFRSGGAWTVSFWVRASLPPKTCHRASVAGADRKGPWVRGSSCRCGSNAVRRV
jgi:hypothetical protein